MIRTTKSPKPARAEPGHNSGEISQTVAAGQLRAFVERVERLDEEIKSLNGDKSEIYKEAKGVGFDVPTIRRIIQARKLDAPEREERDAIFDLYWNALNGAPEPSLARARARVREETASPAPHPPEVDGGQPQPSTDAASAKTDGPLIAVAGQDAEQAIHGSGKSEQQDASEPQGRNEPVSGDGATADNSDGLDIPEFLRRSA